MTSNANPSASAPVGLPRLLAGRAGGGSSTLAQHLAQHGPMPHLPRHERLALLDAIESSGLRGRGGSGFPTAMKMRAVANRRHPKVVIANGCEGEPASLKDALLLTAFPHLVLDGAVLAAEAVRADEVIVAVDRAAVDVQMILARALDERAAFRMKEPSIRVVGVPGRYVAGEESALVHFLNGGDAKPTTIPPRPFERGVNGRPTLVQNVETLSNVALIARFGDAWFRSVGTIQEPGSVLVTVGGAVARPGVCEIALGTSIAAVIDAAGGHTEDVTAFLVGGYFGTWIPAITGWHLPLTHNDLRVAGSTFGCGVIYALPASACGLAETARVARYLAEETAGQCGPCVHGLAAVAGALDSIAAGVQVEQAAAQIARWTGQISGRGACHHPDGAIRLVGTALEVFSEHVEQHQVHGACAATHHAPILPLPALVDRELEWR